jgi:cobalamin biosynthesis protein CbiD
MVMDANTAEHALQILKDKSKLHIFDSIAEEVVRKAVEFAGGKMEIGAALLSLDGEIVGKYNLEACRWGKYML